MTTFVKNIKLIISKGKVEDALEQLQIHLAKGNPKIFNQIAVLSSRYYEHLREERLGLKSDKSELNRISLALLEICDEITEREELQTLSVDKATTKKNAARIRKGLAMKKKFEKDFIDFNLLSKYSLQDRTSKPYLKFKYSEVLIRYVGDITYPNIEETQGKISPHFKSYLYNVYHNGFELWLSAGIGGKVIMDKNGYWEALYDYYDERQNDNKFKVIEVSIFGRIPYCNIEAYNLEGDEYTDYPIIFCDFNYDDMPYEEIVYRAKGQYIPYVDLDKSKMTKF